MKTIIQMSAKAITSVYPRDSDGAADICGIVEGEGICLQRKQRWSNVYFIAKQNDRPSTILIDDKASIPEQRFAVSCGLWFHFMRNTPGAQNKETEKEARFFAKELLVPENKLRLYCKLRLSVKDMSEKFSAPECIISERIKDLSGR